MTTTFATFGVPDELCDVLAAEGITEPLAIQAACLRDGFAGRDIIGHAPTGSGKTLAFGLPLLVDLGRARPRRPLALVLAPTRELAQQISSDLDVLARVAGVRVATVVGGVPEHPQRQALQRGVDLLVATPGRLEDLADRGIVQLGDVKRLVVDEADRMADMGFLPAVERVLAAVPDDRQLVLFSATLDKALEQLAAHQHDAARYEVDAVEHETGDVAHLFWKVPRDERIEVMADVITASGSSIVFTRTRHGADRVARQLAKANVPAVVLHGGRSQAQRDRALASFTAGDSPALVATDVAARGIHVENVGCVVHLDPPEDAATYVHRSGRTGRAGADGTVVSLLDPSIMGKARKQLKGLEHDITPTAPDVGIILRRRSEQRQPQPTRSRPVPSKGPRPDPSTSRARTADHVRGDDAPSRSTPRGGEQVRREPGGQRDTSRQAGAVSRFDPKRGFGFISRERGGDLFVHTSNAGGAVLQQGQAVTFVVGEGRRGPEAVEVLVDGRSQRLHREGPNRKRRPGASSGPARGRTSAPGRRAGRGQRTSGKR